MIHTINIPKRLEATDALTFVSNLSPTDRVTEYQFDFSSLGRVTPGGMLILARGLRDFRNSVKGCRCRIVNHEDQTYPAHMGLFQAIGTKLGNAPGEAPGNKNYQPITVLRKEEIGQEAFAAREQFNEVIEERARNLARVLLRRNEGAAVDLLSYAVREILRNVFEHSEAEDLLYCAQYWSSYQRVEVAIADSGIGLRRSLAPNPDVEVNSDRDAVRVALLPGVSGKVFRGKRANPNDEWAHSGYGLFMVSSLCRRRGAFVMASGSDAVKIVNRAHDYLPTHLSGTALSITLSTADEGSFDDEMRSLRREGEQIARSLKGAVITPSAASGALLRRD